MTRHKKIRPHVQRKEYCNEEEEIMTLYCPVIGPCPQCGHPKIPGNSCNTCKNDNTRPVTERENNNVCS